MIRWFFKYSVFIFLLNTILLSIEYTMNMGYNIFLAIMIISSFLFLINPREVRNILFHKSFSFLLLINLLNLFYFLLFHNINDLEAIKYLLARGVQFSLIAFSIYYNYSYYSRTLFIHLSYVIMAVIVLGFINDPNIFSGRYSGLIWNPNLFGAYCCLAFGMLLLDEGKKNNFFYFMLVTFFIMCLASGSRAVIVGLTIAFFLKFGFSLRNILYSIIILIMFVFIINFDLNTSFNRIYSQSLLEDRILQFEYGLKTFYSKFWTGYGLDKYSYIEKSLVPEHLQGPIKGAHNGYLALLSQYGVIFGFIILFIIIFKAFSVCFRFLYNRNISRVYIFIIIFGLVAALYESLITGINMFHTILFWFSLSFLSFSSYINTDEYKSN